MGIASFSPTGLLGTFQNLVGWLTASAPHQRTLRSIQVSRPATAGSPQWANHAGSLPARLTRTHCSTPPPIASRRPVRVLQVIDTHQPSSHAGRMRISGRMADVCAELDRMAAQETTHRSGARLQ